MIKLNLIFPFNCLTFYIILKFFDYFVYENHYYQFNTKNVWLCLINKILLETKRMEVSAPFLRPVSQALFDLREIRNRSIVIGTRALVKVHLRLRRRKQSGLRLSFRVYTGYHRSPLSVNQERRSGAPWNLSSARRTIEDCDTREITSATNTCLSCHSLEGDQDVRFPQLIDDQLLNEFFILLKNYK